MTDTTVKPDDFKPSSGPKPPPANTQQREASKEGQAQLSQRAATVRSERRRRKDSGPLSGLKLDVPAHLKEAGFEYRWVNDDGRRIHGKTEMDDWDVVKNAAIEGQGEGTPVTRQVGKQEGGAPLMAYLCRKPTEFYQEDKAKEQRLITEREEAMRRGAPASPEGLQGPNTYIPDRADGFSQGPGANRIDRG